MDQALLTVMKSEFQSAVDKVTQRAEKRLKFMDEKEKEFAKRIKMVEEMEERMEEMANVGTIHSFNNV